VKLAAVLDERVGTIVLEKAYAALNLIAEHDPRRMKRMARDLRWIWIKRSAFAPAFSYTSTKVCILDREYWAEQDNPAALLAAVLVHEATHARLFAHGIEYVESARARIEGLCDAQSVMFARRLPDGESVVRRLERRSVDPEVWSDTTLDRRMLESKQVELDAMLADIENAELPTWVKKLLQKWTRARAA
jgi:hypothetical protein